MSVAKTLGHCANMLLPPSSMYGRQGCTVGPNYLSLQAAATAASDVANLFTICSKNFEVKSML